MKRRDSNFEFSSEVDLAKHVVTWLEDQDFDVYQEVKPVHAWGIVDLVGKRGSTICVVECKLRLGEPVILQARRWIEHANLVYVAVPEVKTSSIAAWYMKHIGVGALSVSAFDGAVHTKIEPKIRRRRSSKIEQALCSEQKTYSEAGSSGGNYWSPFKNTCNQIARFVSANPGCSIKAAVDGVHHHYATASSARGALLGWIRSGRVDGVVLEMSGRRALLYPAPARTNDAPAGGGR